MTLRTKDGEMIVANDADYVSELRTILTEASYSPCGDCIDAKGRPTPNPAATVEPATRQPTRRAPP